MSLEETIEARELRLFQRVAELKSVTRTAEEFRLTKSTVSKALSALEAKLGVALLERSSRRIEVTRAGELLLGRARSLVAELDGLAQDVRELQDEVRGQLTVAAPPDLGALFAESLFPAFLAEYPGLHLSLVLDYGFADLQDPAIDVAIRVGSVRDERLVARAIGRVVRILVASPAFARARPMSSPKDLEAHPALVFSEGPSLVPWRLSNGRRNVEVMVSGPLRARSLPVLVRAAAAGLGVALVPELLAHEALQSGRLTRILETWSQSDAQILLVHRFGQHRLRRVAAFIEFAKAHARLDRDTAFP